MQHEDNAPRRQMLWESMWTLYGSQENFRFENGILTTRDCWVADESAARRRRAASHLGRPTSSSV